MRGRKPKPTHLKLLDGNPGRRPLNLPSRSLSGRSPPAPRIYAPRPRRSGNVSRSNSLRSAL